MNIIEELIALSKAGKISQAIDESIHLIELYTIESKPQDINKLIAVIKKLVLLQKDLEINAGKDYSNRFILIITELKNNSEFYNFAINFNKLIVGPEKKPSKRNLLLMTAGIAIIIVLIGAIMLFTPQKTTMSVNENKVSENFEKKIMTTQALTHENDMLLIISEIKNKNKDNQSIQNFYIQPTQVTVSQFKKFIDETGYTTDAEKQGWSMVLDDEMKKPNLKHNISWKFDKFGNEIKESAYNNPVTHISWNDAVAYTKWCGKRLPTADEMYYLLTNQNRKIQQKLFFDNFMREWCISDNNINKKFDKNNHNFAILFTFPATDILQTPISEILIKQIPTYSSGENGFRCAKNY